MFSQNRHPYRWFDKEEHSGIIDHLLNLHAFDMVTVVVLVSVVVVYSKKAKPLLVIPEYVVVLLFEFLVDCQLTFGWLETFWVSLYGNSF